MNKGILILATTAAIALSACGGNAPSETTNAANTTPADNTTRIELPAEGAATPLLMGPNATVKTELTPPQAGNISAVSVRIGNFKNTADGTFRVQICQQTTCSEGTADLAKSVDNRYLTVNLTSPVAVDGKVPVAVNITRIGGAGQFALWTHPGTDKIITPTAQTQDGNLKVALDYAK